MLTVFIILFREFLEEILSHVPGQAMYIPLLIYYTIVFIIATIALIICSISMFITPIIASILLAYYVRISESKRIFIKNLEKSLEKSLHTFLETTVFKQYVSVKSDNPIKKLYNKIIDRSISEISAKLDTIIDPRFRLTNILFVIIGTITYYALFILTTMELDREALSTVFSEKQGFQFILTILFIEKPLYTIIILSLLVIGTYLSYKKLYRQAIQSIMLDLITVYTTRYAIMLWLLALLNYIFLMLYRSFIYLSFVKEGFSIKQIVIITLLLLFSVLTILFTRSLYYLLFIKTRGILDMVRKLVNDYLKKNQVMLEVITRDNLKFKGFLREILKDQSLYLVNEDTEQIIILQEPDIKHLIIYYGHNQ